MKAKAKEQAEAECVALVRKPGEARGTRVRTRCKGQALDNEVREQMTKALPHIVRANVEKAKEGSLMHTKWLWWVTQEALRKVSSEEQAKAKASLAELLQEQLNQGLS